MNRKYIYTAFPYCVDIKPSVCRRRFETGKHKMSTKRFLGYDADENGKLVINRLQEPIVVRLYQEFLDGKTTDYIKRIFEKEGIKNWD